MAIDLSLPVQNPICAFGIQNFVYGVRHLQALQSDLKVQQAASKVIHNQPSQAKSRLIYAIHLTLGILYLIPVLGHMLALVQKYLNRCSFFSCSHVQNQQRQTQPLNPSPLVPNPSKTETKKTSNSRGISPLVNPSPSIVVTPLVAPKQVVNRPNPVKTPPSVMPLVVSPEEKLPSFFKDNLTDDDVLCFRMFCCDFFPELKDMKVGSFSNITGPFFLKLLKAFSTKLGIEDFVKMYEDYVFFTNLLHRSFQGRILPDGAASENKYYVDLAVKSLQLTVGQQCLFPLYVYSCEGGGHAVNIFIKREGDNQYSLALINTGAGVRHHPAGSVKPTADAPYWISPAFRRKNIEKKELLEILNELAKRSCVKYIHAERNFKIYYDFISKFGENGGVSGADIEPQNSGTCTMSVQSASLAACVSQGTYQRFLLLAATAVTCEYYQKNKKRLEEIADRLEHKQPVTGVSHENGDRAKLQYLKKAHQYIVKLLNRDRMYNQDNPLSQSQEKMLGEISQMVCRAKIPEEIIPKKFDCDSEHIFILNKFNKCFVSRYGRLGSLAQPIYDIIATEAYNFLQSRCQRGFKTTLQIALSSIYPTINFSKDIEQALTSLAEAKSTTVQSIE